MTMKNDSGIKSFGDKNEFLVQGFHREIERLEENYIHFMAESDQC
jgi:hypothetical protein